MRIATFSPISNGALSHKDLPLAIKVLSFGKTETLDDPIFVSEKTKKTFSATQKRIGRERVPIDFNHNTVQGSAAYEEDSEPRRIAGYGDPTVKEDGIWLENITWTPTGEEAARDYEDLSPAPLLDDKNTVIGLHSVALCPAGAISDLHFYSADHVFQNKKPSMKLTAEEEAKEKADKEKKLEVKPQAASEVKAHEEGCLCAECADKKNFTSPSLSAEATGGGTNVVKTMAVVPLKAYLTEPENNEKFRKHMDETLKKFASELGLPDSEEHMKKFEALVAEWRGEVKVASPITGDPKPAQFSAEVTKLEQRIAVLETDRQEQIARFAAMEKDQIVSDATKNGKVVPFSAEEIKELNPKTLKSIIDKLPATVPLAAKTKVLSAEGKQESKKTREDAAKAIQDQVDAVLAKS